MKQSTTTIPMKPSAPALLHASLIIKTLIWCVATFTVLNVGVIYLRYTRFSDTAVEHLAIQLFSTDSEANLPAFYSALAILLCCIIAWLIGCSTSTEHPGTRRRWLGMAVILLALSVDEICSYHEKFSDLIKSVLLNLEVTLPAWLHWPWVILGLMFVIVIASIYLPFILALPPAVRRLILIGGGVFVAGAVGMESIGAAVTKTHGYGLGNAICSTVEELLEMTGVVILAKGLLLQLTSVSPVIKLQFANPLERDSSIAQSNTRANPIQS